MAKYVVRRMFLTDRKIMRVNGLEVDEMTDREADELLKGALWVYIQKSKDRAWLKRLLEAFLAENVSGNKVRTVLDSLNEVAISEETDILEY